MNRMIDTIEKEQEKAEANTFNVGDSVNVHTRVLEGDKERIQVFAGTVIGRKGRGLNETFTVRRISYGEGVERVFPLHSPRIAKMYRGCGFRYEKKLRAIGVARIAGIDEGGRGALAGPVVAAAVVLPEKFRHRRLNDSKQLAPELREEIYVDLTSNSQITWAVGVVDSIEIDRINI